ncbi:MAG: hypothetical protein J5529_08840 [Prevotella sp.]|nr:hypothetical protein [Prevotella sp.]
MDKHHIKPFVLAWLLALVSLTTAAQKNRLTVDDVLLSAGGQATLHVAMDNTQDIVGVQFTLTLPAGFSLDIPSLVKTERLANHRVSPRKTGNNEYMFIVYSSANQPISSIGGELFAITLQAASSVAGGKTYDMVLTDVVMSLRGGENVVEETVAGHIVVKNLPDLHVVAVDCSEAVAGMNLTIQWTVRNDGGDTESQSWKDYVWLTPDILGGSNVTGRRLLAVVDNPVGLNAGASYENSVTVTLPERMYGLYDIVVCTDMYCVDDIDLTPAGGTLPRPYEPETADYGFLYAQRVSSDLVAEEGESGGRSDNFFYQQIDIGVPPLPDLVVRSVVIDSLYIPDTYSYIVKEGSKSRGGKVNTGFLVDLVYSYMGFYVGASIANQGDKAIEKTKIWNIVYISHSPDPNAEPLRPIEWSNIFISLSPGDSTYWSKRVYVPLDWYGDTYFHVQVDAEDAVYELANTANNWGCSEKMDVLLTPGADLEVTSVIMPNKVTAGEPFKFTYEVDNKGPGEPNEKAWDDKVYATQHGSPLTDDSPCIATIAYGKRTSGSSSGSGSSGTTYGLVHSESGGSSGGAIQVLPFTGYSKDVDVTMKDFAPGTYDIYLMLDADNKVFEYEGEDNNTYGPITMQVVQADLAPQLLTVSADTLASNAKVAFSWKVTNQGEGELKNVKLTDRFYAAKNANGDNAILLGQVTNMVTIAAGVEKTLMANLTIPSKENLSGYRYIYVTTNVDNRIEEVSTANNKSNMMRKYFLYTDETLPTPIDSRPNLVVNTLTAPATVTPGGQVTLSYMVTNSGLSAVGKNVLQEVFVSKSSVFSRSESTPCTLSSQQAALNGLGSGKKKTIHVTAIIPENVMGGDCYLHIVLNRDGMLSETYTDDDNAAARTYIYGNLPDLVIQDIQVPANVTTSTPAEVTWTLCNNGTWKADANTILVYLSSDGTQQDILLATLATSELSNGATVSMRTTLNLPDDKDGEQYLLFVVNPKKSMEELSIANNTAKAALHVVQAPLSDLQISLLSVEGRCRGGDTITVTAKVSNIGDDITHVDKWADAAYITNGYTLDTNTDRSLGSKAHNGNLPVGKDYTFSLRLRLPDNLSGYYVLHISADPTGAMVDKNRSNNTARQTLMVEGRQDAPADLEVSRVTTDAHITAGAPVTIDYEVSNVGYFEAEGTLHDAIYLSTDDRWDVNDLFVGTVSGEVNILPGQALTRHATGRIANVVEGNYHIIVKTNATQGIFESDYDNNDGVQTSTSAIEFAYLQPGTSATVNTVGYYKVAMQQEEAKSTLALRLQSPDNAQAGLYVAYEAVPSTARYDYGTTDWRSNDQQIILPHTQEGTYYVLAQANAFSGQGLYDFTLDEGESSSSQVTMTLTAEEIPFGASRLSITEGGKDGWVSTGIQGALLDSIMDFRLIKDDKVIPVERLVFNNSSSTDVTFNLDKADIGTYDLLSELPDGTQATLKDAFKVVPATSVGLGVKIEAPHWVRMEESVPVTISYANSGKTDIVLRAFLFASEDGDFATTTDGLKTNPQNIICLYPDGEQDVRGCITIPPGKQGVMRCFFKQYVVGASYLYLYVVK